MRCNNTINRSEGGCQRIGTSRNRPIVQLDRYGAGPGEPRQRSAHYACLRSLDIKLEKVNALPALVTEQRFARSTPRHRMLAQP